MIDRLKRVEEMIKREISIILRTEVDDDMLMNVTIMRVEVTRDLRLAKVFYTVYDACKGDGKITEIDHRLKKVSKFVRGCLSNKLSMKFTPRILFREDVSRKKDESLRNIFDQIEKEHHPEKDCDEKGVCDEY